MDDLKNLLLVLDEHLTEMYDCFINDESNLALFHLGAIQAIVTHYSAKHGFNRASNSADQNRIRSESNGALDKETQTSQASTNACACGTQVQTLEYRRAECKSHPIANSSSDAGRGQFTIFNEMGAG